MTRHSRRFGVRLLAPALLSFFAAAGLPALAQSPTPAPSAQASRVVEVTDVAGRKVQVRAPVERVILGEGQQIYFVAALDKENRSNASWRGATIS